MAKQGVQKMWSGTANRCTQNHRPPTWGNKFVQTSWPRASVQKVLANYIQNFGRRGVASELLRSAESSSPSWGQGPGPPVPERGRALRPGALWVAVTGTQGQRNDDRVIHYTSLECWVLKTSPRFFKNGAGLNLHGMREGWGEKMGCRPGRCLWHQIGFTLGSKLVTGT